MAADDRGTRLAYELSPICSRPPERELQGPQINPSAELTGAQDVHSKDSPVTLQLQPEGD
jgi:hypothetical protein